MDSVATLLPKVLRKRGIKGEADASFVIFVATEWLKARQSNVIPTKYERGVLLLEAHSSVAAQECMGLSEELLADLRARFPEMAIERIQIIRTGKAHAKEKGPALH